MNILMHSLVAGIGSSKYVVATIVREDVVFGTSFVITFSMSSSAWQSYCLVQ